MRMRFFQRDSHFGNSQRQRPWPVTACGRLLALEGLGLLALAWLNAPESARPSLGESWLALTLAFLGLLALLTSLSFLRLRARARDRAMFLQGITLSLALFFYLGEGPAFIYALMFYSLFMVLYLQHPDVRVSFPYDSVEGGSEPLP